MTTRRGASKRPGGAKARRLRRRRLLREWGMALSGAVILVALITGFGFMIIRVSGNSMHDTLRNGERMFVTAWDVRFGAIARDAVVVCRYPRRGLTCFVKRCVGLPGDAVYRRNGVTHVVNGETGEDVALDPNRAARYPNGGPDDYDAYVLGEDEYFVVGDNRYNSHDSRDWKDRDDARDVGPISKRMILGHVRRVVWPLASWRSVE